MAGRINPAPTTIQNTWFPHVPFDLIPRSQIPLIFIAHFAFSPLKWQAGCSVALIPLNAAIRSHMSAASSVLCCFGGCEAVIR